MTERQLFDLHKTYLRIQAYVLSMYWYNNLLSSCIKEVALVIALKKI